MNAADALKAATMSECGKYRYRLYRRWYPDKGLVLWIMLNPSKADAHVDDPTIKRCINYSAQWGYGAILVGNIFPYRATNPYELKAVDRDGVGNWLHIREMSLSANLVVCAWGANELTSHARENVLDNVHDRPVKCLGLSPSGSPFHPLQRTRRLHLPTVLELTEYGATK